VKKTIQKSIPKFYYPHKAFKNKEFKLLDVGSGNHSASKTKSLFPNCEYHGIDLQKDFHNDERDYVAMHAFYEMDLTKLNFSEIPDNYFDFIRMAHVIEHLKNGDEVIKGLLSKLKKGGYIYIEYPGKKSLTLPSMNETLNFYDDPTHVRVYSVKEVAGILKENNFQIISSGTRRNPAFIAAMPFRVILSLIKRKKLVGNMFWDLLGFAEFVFARK
jgi:ubiquinone/menaquinone biosynthesis C-methylase UbiE